MEKYYPFVALFFMLAYSHTAQGQAPQKMSFQTVIRDENGQLAANKTVSMRIAILKGAPDGSAVYTEAHYPATNANGLASFEIGAGTPIGGTFSGIDWSQGPYFLKTETDINGGFAYNILGVSQLLSVPYALHAQTAQFAENANQTEYMAGPGISISDAIITNAAPDQVVTLSGAGSTAVTGNYPDFVITSTGTTVAYTAGPGIDIAGTIITNTAPNQVVTLAGAGATTVSGTYPNFTVSSVDNNTTYTAGTGISISGTTINNTAPDKVVTLAGAGATTVSGTYPNFTVSSVDNNTTYTAGTGISISGTTINNTAPNQVVNLAAGPGINIFGTYPNFLITAPQPTTHYVGELFGGGLVFYTYDNGAHGLIVSLADLSPAIIWHQGVSVTNATNYYDGGINTNQIVAAQGTGTYAAKICKDYNAGGFTDWYLPSTWELNLLHQNGVMVSYKLANDGVPATTPLDATGFYWSSTEFNNELSYMIYFPDGTPYLDFKNKTYRVRAVRRF